MATIRLNIAPILAPSALLSARVLKMPPIEFDSARYGDVIDLEAPNPGALIRKPARDIYDLKYFLAKNHKPIAPPGSGARAWTRRQVTLEGALNKSLGLCRDRNGADEKQQPCELVYVDGWRPPKFSCANTAAGSVAGKKLIV